MQAVRYGSRGSGRVGTLKVDDETATTQTKRKLITRILYPNTFSSFKLVAVLL